MVLTEICGRHGPAELHGAFLRLALAEERLDERRLSSAVRADERDHVAAVRGCGEIADERAVADRDRERLGGDHAVAAAFGDLEAQLHRAAGARRRREARKPVEALAASLGLRCVLSGDVAADVVLFLRDHLPLLVHLPLERETALGALLHEARVAAAIRFRRAALEVQHMIGDLVEERAIVADHDHRFIEVADVLLQPRRRLEVEMVRGLVEQEEVRGSNELRREADPSALATAQRGHAPRLRFFRVECESLQHGVDARVKRVPTFVGEALEIVPVLLEQRRRRALPEFGELRRLFGERKFERHHRRIWQRRRVPYADRAAEIAVLVEKRHAEPRRARHRAANRRQRAGDDLEERRLAAAVATHDSPAIALPDREGDVVKEGRGAEFHGDIGKRELGHSRKIAVGPEHLEC